MLCWDIHEGLHLLHGKDSVTCSLNLNNLSSLAQARVQFLATVGRIVLRMKFAAHLLTLQFTATLQPSFLVYP